ncbi:GTP-binding protein 8-like isoform X2 [Biomphalaria glabrata]|uniref:GTP-binding protein 8-like isoform X2 n=1 Tax=Biomphalaria glabrata TaxID=6526 RepID=A0A9W3B6Q3_BIOGL|nr:GTP-binding protein 8-like isoform X2 [Biomphalaria glabrata]
MRSLCTMSTFKSVLILGKRSHCQMTFTCLRYLHKSASASSLENPVKPVSDLFTNPVDRLQPLLQIPIIPNTDRAFRPSRKEIEEASLLFEPKNLVGECFKFLGAYPNPHIMPRWDVPEVAFIGKSNVGKSSLLAAMFAQVPDLKVRVSSKPGHTKLMNVFNVSNLFHLIDMPGYGFNMPDHFETSVEAYLKTRRSKMTFILFDGRVGMTQNDQKYFQRYSDLQIPMCMVLTKIDLAKPSALLRSIVSCLRFRDETKANSCFPQPFLVSSMNGEGLAFLQSFIAYITGNLKIESLT